MASGTHAVFRLYLLRHAHAGWPAPGTSDFERSLDERGIAEARDVAEQALLGGLRPDRIVSSPARRCRETTEAMLDVFTGLMAELDERLYSNGEEAYLAQIRANFDRPSLMLVGHNPMIEALATMLGADSAVIDGLAMGYPPAGLLVLDFDRAAGLQHLRSATPVQFITPSLM